MRTRLSSKRERCSINERHSAGNRLPPRSLTGRWPRKPAQEAICGLSVAALRPVVCVVMAAAVCGTYAVWTWRDLLRPAVRPLELSGRWVQTAGRTNSFGLLPPGGDLARPRAQRMAGDCRLRWLRGDRQRVAGRIWCLDRPSRPFQTDLSAPRPVPGLAPGGTLAELSAGIPMGKPEQLPAAHFPGFDFLPEHGQERDLRGDRIAAAARQNVARRRHRVIQRPTDLAGQRTRMAGKPLP